MNISIVGSGYVGITTGACLADQGHHVLCMDIDAKKVESLSKGEIPFYEPGLKELVVRNLKKGRLHFTTDAKKAVEHAKAIFNCVGTPGNEDGSANLQYVFDVARTVAEFANGYKVLINKSTVPPGTARKTQEIINTTNALAEVDVVSNPEFLKEGAAVSDFIHPDKIVVGTNNSPKAQQVMKEVYFGRLRTYIPVVETDWETAELIKYANNSFLATKISFINEMANICDTVGADVRILSKVLGLDYRISPKFLNPGVGYGGSCFPKDVRALTHTAKDKGYDAKLLRQVDHTNELQKEVLVKKILQSFDNELAGKTLCIWGLSFKPKTSDMREAPSITIVKKLLLHGATVKAYDPVAMDEAKKVFGQTITYCSSPEQAAQNSDAIVVVTEWNEFRGIDLEAIGNTMRQKKLFDGRNIYEPQMVKEEGFEYYGIGRQ